MGTTIRYLGEMRIEQQELDEAGREAQEQLNELAMREYEQTGSLSSLPLSETVTAYEKVIETHVLRGHGKQKP